MRKSSFNPSIDLDQYERSRPRVRSQVPYVAPIATAAPAFVAAPEQVPFIGANKTLRKKLQRKFLSYHIASSLADLNSPLKKTYLRTLHCAKEIRQEGRELTSMYCGNRWCLVCCAIRTSKLFDRYTEMLKGFNDAHFVTLTVRNINADVETLKHYQKTMFSHHRKVQDMLRKYGVKLKGVRKYEPIVAKHDSKMLHPHFHWTIDGTITEDKIFEVWATQKLCPDTLLNLIDKYEKGEITLGYMKGEMIIQLWLKRHKGITDRKGQHVTPVTAGTELELFKYETKMLVTNKQQGHHIPVRTLDVIYQATKSVRTIQCTGYITRMPTEPVYYNGHYNVPYMDKKQWLETNRKTIDFFSTDEELFVKYPYPEIFSKHTEKLLEYLTYKSFTETEDEDINKDLKAQIIPEAKAQSTVWAWRGCNYYCISTGQPLLKYSLGRYESGFLLAIDSS